jgi:DNA repair exonuclease SbcCD ATPase subunit
VQSSIKVISERPELASQALIVSRRPSISSEIFQALIRLFIGILIAVSATLAWQSYSDEARKLVGTRAPAAAWLLPVSPLESPADRHESAQEAAAPQTEPVAQKIPAVPSSESARQLEPITRDLAAVRSSLEQLAVKQGQMAQAVSSSDSARQLEPITRDLAAVRSSLEQLAVKQEQMAQAVSSSDSAQQLEPITRDLAAVRSSLEQLAVNQEHMAKNIATLQAVVQQDIKDKKSAQLPSQAVPLPQRKPPHAAR